MKEDDRKAALFFLDFLDERPAPLVLLRLEVVPLGLYLAVQFQFGIALGVLEA